LSFTGVLASSAQSVRFQFYRTKACTIIEKLDTVYSLYKIPGSVHTDYFPKKGTVYLPGPGTYKIVTRGPLLDTVFNIRDTGLFIFRYREPDHGLYYTGALDTPPLYSHCDTLLDGYQEYHYPGGNLEMRGTFKKGHEKDSIVTFYRNGQIKSRMLRFPKLITVTSFDSLGHKIRYYNGQNKSFMTYIEFDDTEFYTDGKVKKKQSSKNYIKTLEAYYPSGKPKIIHTKRFRTEYYETGLKKITYTWTFKRDHIVHSKDFTICKTEFDATGQVTRKTVYNEWGTHPVDQPGLAVTYSSWIASLDRFENGKNVFSAKDMDTKEFMKKYPAELNDNDVDDR